MVEYRVPGLPVIGNGELIGIVTEADLIQREANVDMPSIIPFSTQSSSRTRERHSKRSCVGSWPLRRKS